MSAMKRLNPLRLTQLPRPAPAARVREADAIASYRSIAALAIHRLPVGYRLNREG
jgi:hypothetical protein